MPDPAPRLDYGARRKTSRRLRRVAELLAVLALLGGVAYRWGPGWKHHATILLDQRRFMNYRAPPGQVVCDLPPGANGLHSEVKTCYAPPFWSRYKASNAPAAAVVFLHARTSPAGTRRIVCVEAEPFWVTAEGGPSAKLMWRVHVFAPDPLRGATALLGNGDAASDFLQEYFATAERVYAGQPDPSDPSHCVIEVESRGKPHTIDGWLQDDKTPLFRLQSSAPIAPPPPPTTAETSPSGG
jgi:hypothetical protein